jgi:hypothetical protein
VTLPDLKKLAESFRPHAGNKAATTKAVDDALAAHPNDVEVADFCTDFQSAKDKAAAIAVIDAVAAK